MGKTVSEHYATKLARFQTDQARRKERKEARQYAAQLAYNKPCLRRYRRRLKREQKERLKRFLQEAHRSVNDAVAASRANKLRIKADRLAAANAKVDAKTELARLKDAEQRRGWLEAGPIPDGVRRAIVREKLHREAERF